MSRRAGRFAALTPFQKSLAYHIVHRFIETVPNGLLQDHSELWRKSDTYLLDGTHG